MGSIYMKAFKTELNASLNNNQLFDNNLILLDFKRVIPVDWQTLSSGESQSAGYWMLFETQASESSIMLKSEKVTVKTQKTNKENLAKIQYRKTTIYKIMHC